MMGFQGQCAMSSSESGCAEEVLDEGVLVRMEYRCRYTKTVTPDEKLAPSRLLLGLTRWLCVVQLSR